MPGPVVPRFRTRLSVAFVLLAAVTSGLLALGSFLTIKEYRYRSFARHAEEVARLGLLSAPRDLSGANFENGTNSGPEPASRPSFLFMTGVYSSSNEIGAADIPAGLLSVLEPGELAKITTAVQGRPYLVLGGTP